MQTSLRKFKPIIRRRTSRKKLKSSIATASRGLKDVIEKYGPQSVGMLCSGIPIIKDRKLAPDRHFVVVYSIFRDHPNKKCNLTQNHP